MHRPRAPIGQAGQNGGPAQAIAVLLHAFSCDTSGSSGCWTLGPLFRELFLLTNAVRFRICESLKAFRSNAAQMTKVIEAR